MPRYDGPRQPVGLPDLGDDGGSPADNVEWIESLRARLLEGFPERSFIASPIGNINPALARPGYSRARVQVLRRQGEGDDSFELVSRQVSNVLEGTEDDMTQPDSGVPHVCDVAGPTPIPETRRDSSTRAVAYEWTFHPVPNLVSAEGVQRA